MSDAKDVEITPPPTDAISAVTWSSTDPNLLAVANWNNTVKTFDANAVRETSSFSHTGPVLDIAFGEASYSGKVYSGGIDRNLRELDLESNKQSILGSHNDAIRCVKWGTNGSIISGSWDATLRMTDPRTEASASPISVSLPEKVYSLDALDHKIVVAMAKRHIYIFDDRKISEPEQKRESSLKYMTRVVRIAPDADAYVSTSIEGRVAVEFFDMSDDMQKKKYAFKCHRQNVNDVDTVYPVNALAFHPVHGTFATGGGDAVVSIWDLSAKKRIRQYPKYAGSIWSLSFNSDGTKLAIASALVEEEGTASDSRNALYVRTATDGEFKPKTR